jgi:hypothetical protein
MENQGQPAPQVPPAAPQSQAQQPAPSAPEKSLSKTEKVRRTFFQVLIACLLGSAAIAVGAVLAGGFNSTLGRAVATLAMVALHSAFSFGYVSETEKRGKDNFTRSLELFDNAVFALIVASFATSILAIWQVIGVDITFKLYMAYGVLLFATLHANVLYRLRGFDKKIDLVVAANYAVMAVVVAMLFILIFTEDHSTIADFFYRLLAATAIVDATMTISAIIMHKMHLQKHPELSAKAAEAAVPQSKNFWHNPLVILLLIFLAFQVIGGFFALLMN